MKKFCVFIVLSLILFPVFTFAEEAAETEKKITIDLPTVIQKALQTSEELREADGEIMIYQGKKMKAMAGYAPTIDVKASYNRLDEDKMIYTSFGQGLFDLIGDIVTRQLYLSAFNPYSSMFPSYTTDKNGDGVPDGLSTGFVTYAMPQEFALLQVDFKLPLWTWWKIPGYNKMAKAGVAVAMERKRQKKSDVIYEAANMYFQTLFVRFAKNIVDDTYQRLQATYDLSKNIFEGGTGKVTKTDLLKAKIGLSRAQFKAAEADRGWYLSREALKRYMGLDDYQLEFMDKDIFYKKVELDLDQLIDMMYKNRPEWKQANYGVIAKDANVKVSLSDMLPMLALLGEYKSFTLIGTSEEDSLSETVGYNGIDDYPNPYPDKDEWRVTLGANIPLSYWSLYPDYKIAKGEAAKMRAKRDWARASLKLQVKKAYAELNENMKKIEASKKIKDDSKDRYQLMYKAFQVGMAELGDVITAQIDAALFKQQYNQAVYDYNKACLELNKVVGTDVITWE